MTMLNVATAGAALRAKLTTIKGADRADLYLADTVPVSASEARLLLGYNPRFGTPTQAQVASFVGAATQNLSKSGPLKVQLETLKDHPVSSVHAAMSVVVSSPRRIASLDASRNFLAVSSTMFYDNALQANWAVKDGPDGVKFLECTSKENVPELLNTAIASQGLLSRPVSFAMPELEAVATTQVSVGDYVEFWADGGLRRGDVTKVNGDEVTISGEDRPWTVPAASVNRILRLNAKAQKEEENRELAVFSAIWGKDFANELVKLNKAKK